MEQVLKDHFETKEWLKDLFDNAHDLIQIAQLDGTLIYVNNSWSSLLEYSQGEIKGESLYSFIIEEDIPRFIEYRNQILDGLMPETDIAFGLKTKSGRVVVVEGFVSVKRSDGRPLYTRGIFRDITLRLKNEAQLNRFNEELKEKEYNLQQLLYNAPDAVIVIDQESYIRFWNPKAEEIFGWQEEEVLHKPLSSTIIPVHYRQAHEMGMRRYLTTGEAHVLNKSIEITALNKQGNEFYISLTISRTLQMGNIAFIAFIRDITEQKANQLELERKTRELEYSNANLEEFAYAASHDLKEPIRKIRLFSQHLKEQLKAGLKPEEERLFYKIERATKRMNTLIDDLLTYSSVTRELNFLDVVDLNQVVQAVLEDLELEIQERAAQIATDSLPVINGHARQMQQLFQNLISNALKYSKQGFVPRVSIQSKIVVGNETGLTLSVEEQQQEFYLIQVKDNGIGFEPKNAERIFNVFQRLHSDNEYRGTGIGLSIVRKVAENHQGMVWAEAEPGEGATFNILFPVK